MRSSHCLLCVFGFMDDGGVPPRHFAVYPSLPSRRDRTLPSHPGGTVRCKHSFSPWGNITFATPIAARYPPTAKDYISSLAP